MSYELRKGHGGCHGLTPSERRALVYEKEPVDTVADLWEKYPEGGHPGWYCLIKGEHALYGWDDQVHDWTELGQGLLSGKHDKSAGMLMRLLNPGDYSERNGVVAGEVFIVPLTEGDYGFYEEGYPRNKQSFYVNEVELGQVILYAENGVWRKQLLPIHDFIQDALLTYQHNRGVVLNPPNEVAFNPPARLSDYVYYKGKEDRYPMMWVYDGKLWQKTMGIMPSAEVTGLAEYAKHGYKPGERQKTLAEVERQIEGERGNVDGGNAASVYGGCMVVDGGKGGAKF